MPDGQPLGPQQTQLHAAGNPNAVHSAQIRALYFDDTNADLYINTDGVSAWQLIGGGSGGGGPTPWTLTSGVIHPTTIGNEVSVGTTSSIANFTVFGDTIAQRTVGIRPVAAQTADILVIQTDGGVDIVNLRPPTQGGNWLNLQPPVRNNVGAPVDIRLQSAAHTAIPVHNARDVVLDMSATLQFTAGATIAQTSGLYLEGRTYSATGAQTITEAATLRIVNPPLAGAGPMTITRPFSILVVSGNVAFRGGANVGATNLATAAGELAAGTAGVGQMIFTPSAQFILRNAADLVNVTISSLVGVNTIFNSQLANIDFTVGALLGNNFQVDASEGRFIARQEFAWIDQTVSLITANQNNYDPSNGTFLRLSSDAAYNITGLGGTATGRFQIFANVTAFDLTFTNEDVLSLAANRIHTHDGASITLATDEMVAFLYDSVTTRWRPFAGTAISGGAAASPWTTTGAIIHPLVLGNEVSVGTALSFGKFTVLGDTVGQVTVAIRPVAAQTANLLDFQDSAGTVISFFDVFGRLFINRQGGGDTVTLTAAGTNLPARILCQNSRGTIAAPTDVINGDTLAALQANARSGGVFFGTAQITYHVDGTFTSGDRPPSRISFFTNQANASPLEAMRIIGAGHLRPVTDSLVSLGVDSFRFLNVQAVTFECRDAAGDVNPTTRISSEAIRFGSGGASLLDLLLLRTTGALAQLSNNTGGGAGLEMLEAATVPGGARAAARGRYWVKNDAPSTPQFTDDTNVDHNLLNQTSISSAEDVFVYSMMHNLA